MYEICSYMFIHVHIHILFFVKLLFNVTENNNNVKTLKIIKNNLKR